MSEIFFYFSDVVMYGQNRLHLFTVNLFISFFFYRDSSSMLFEGRRINQFVDLRSLKKQKNVQQPENHSQLRFTSGTAFFRLSAGSFLEVCLFFEKHPSISLFNSDVVVCLLNSTFSLSKKKIMFLVLSQKFRFLVVMSNFFGNLFPQDLQ